jgi:hypothetical protein
MLEKYSSEAFSGWHQSLKLEAAYGAKLFGPQQLCRQQGDIWFLGCG